jgi:hypothetical protein
VRARLLRSSLLASAVAVVLVGLPLAVLGSLLLLREGREELREHTDAVHMVVLMRGDEPLEQVRGRVVRFWRGDSVLDL